MLLLLPQQRGLAAVSQKQQVLPNVNGGCFSIEHSSLLDASVKQGMMNHTLVLPAANVC